MDTYNERLMHKTIAHWYRVRDGIEPVRCDNCPLCKAYNNYDTDYKDACVGCPIFDHTNKLGCRCTPYDELYYHSSIYHPDEDTGNHCPKCETLIDKEIEFLKEVERELNENS